MIKVLSIIVSYNFEPWLTTCLNSLFQSSFPTDVMVIDNASTDNTLSRIRQEFPKVILHENKQNLGFGKANNLGFDYAIAKGYDAVFLVNQDAWIHSDCLQEMLSQKYGGDVGIISPMHYDGTGMQLDEGFQHYIQQTHVGNQLIFITPFVNAAFWLIPIQVLKEIGGFSPLFYHYGEDTDYANRLHYHGYHFVVHTNAIAYHDRQGRKALGDEAFFHREYVYHLTAYADINYSFPKAFAQGVLAPLKKAVAGGHPRRKSRFLSYLNVAWKVCLKTVSVLRTRQENR